MKGRLGRNVAVYDARKWPVVHCGSVFVTPDDTVQHIKSAILATNITKSKKSSKHALAIGSSFGHVHSFLKDDIHLLQKLEDRQEECLMLIKKPKSASKQMLKSQSWSNLSAPESNYYHQVDAGQQGDPRSNYRIKMKKKSSLECKLAPVRDLSPQSKQSDDGGFLSHKQNGKRWQTVKDSSYESPGNRMKTAMDTTIDTSVSSGYKSLDRKDSSFLRRHGPVDLKNNYHILRKDGRQYQSVNDINLRSPSLAAIHPDEDECTIKSDEFYSDTTSQANTSIVTSDLNESKDQETVARSHSLGDLSTGLTLSLVGQRKAESIQSLPLAAQKTLTKKSHFAKRKADAKVHTKYQNANKPKQSIESQIQHIIQSGEEADGQIKTNEAGDSFTQPKICKTNAQVQRENGLSTMNVQKVLKADLLPDKSRGISMVKSEKEDDTLSEKSNHSVISSSAKTPNRPRRSLPVVPKGYEEVGEKKKRYTEMVKMRVSVHSSNSCSSASRQSIMSPGSEGLSQNESQNELSSDREVYELLGNVRKHQKELNPSQPVNSNEMFSPQSQGNFYDKKTNASNMYSSLPPGVRSCDSGQTTVRSCDSSGQNTLMSVSSTVDSGYMTTDAESDISSYTRSLQISAHNLYSASKLNNYTVGNVSRQDIQSNKLGNGKSNFMQIQRSPLSPNTSANSSLLSPVNDMKMSSQNLVPKPLPEANLISNGTVGMDNGNISYSNTNLPQVKLQSQSFNRNAPMKEDLDRNVSKGRPRSAQISGKGTSTVSEISALDSKIANSHQSFVNGKQDTQHSQATKSVSLGLENTPKSTRRDSMENLTQKDDYIHNYVSTSKGLSHSYTLPRSSNPYNQMVHNPNFKNFSSPQPVTFSGNGALDCDINFLKSKPDYSCQEKLVNTSMQYNNNNNNTTVNVQETPCLNNNTYTTTSYMVENSSAIPPQKCDLPNKLTPKVFNHDYVNVQGREIRLGVNYDGEDPNSVNSNIYEEFHSGCQECLKQGKQNQEQYDLYPRNQKHEGNFVPVKVLPNEPSLYQMMQTYDFYPLHIKLCDNLPASGFISFSDSSFALKNTKQNKRDAFAISTPQGKCATIGGPGSAFTPVKNPVSTTTTFSMVTVCSISTHESCDFAGIQKGDIVVEVNDKNVLSSSAADVKSSIQDQPGDINILIARPKPDTAEKEDILKKKDEEIDSLKKQLATMYMDLQKKSKALQSLTSPWRKSGNITKNEINGNIMSHEAILNALSEDEYIV